MKPWMQNPAAEFAKLPKRIRKRIRRVSPRATACWLWIGAKHYLGQSGVGYGRITWKGTNQLAHRVVTEIIDGEPMPPDLQFDHLLERCTSPACVRPDHGDHVTAAINGQRANAAKHAKMQLKRERLARPHITVVAMLADPDYETPF